MRTITIGRSNRCDIVIPDTVISKVHAEISLVNNQYVYRDVSKNGTNIGGRMINNDRVNIAPGASVLLANRHPLPWAQVYALLPTHRAHVPDGDETVVVPMWTNTPVGQDRLGVGWGILAFLVPIAGWIMYFCWKEKTPERASQASTLAWIGFGLGILLRILA
jgi:pSer/pThr/pTyr-binding forkhead associated (FHA) protein